MAADHPDRPCLLGNGVEMLRGESDIVTGMKNKIQTTVANVTPNEMLAKQHRRMAEPGAAKS